MSNWFSSFMKKKVLRKNQNLVSLDEPYEVMRRLLRDHEVKGIIDAGASHGRISRRLLRKFPEAQVYAFEPNPLYTETLEEYAKDEPRFHPQYMALSDHEGDATLNVTKSPGVTSLYAPGDRLKEIEPEGASVESVQQVELATIDQWAERHGDPGIELMKFDIQGAELKALQGAVQTLESSTFIVYTEIWFNPVYEGGALFGEIDMFLREQGFALYDIYKPKYNPNGLIMWADAIFVNTQRFGL